MEVEPPDLLQQSQEPVKRLAAALEALSGKNSSRRTAETWLPLPGLWASQGRRGLYATVALSPQLLPLEDHEVEQVEQAMSPRKLEEVDLESFRGLAIEKYIARSVKRPQRI